MPRHQALPIHIVGNILRTVPDVVCVRLKNRIQSELFEKYTHVPINLIIMHCGQISKYIILNSIKRYVNKKFVQKRQKLRLNYGVKTSERAISNIYPFLTNDVIGKKNDIYNNIIMTQSDISKT